MSNKSKQNQTSKKNQQKSDFTQLTRAERNSTLKKIGIVFICVVLALAMTVPSLALILAN